MLFTNLGASANPDINVNTDLVGYSGTSWTPPAYGAKGREIPFNLSVEQFAEIVYRPCAYCGQEPSEFSGIDRVDNGRGYEPDNCVPCCKTCNVSKNSHTKEDFLSWVKRVYERNFS